MLECEDCKSIGYRAGPDKYECYYCSIRDRTTGEV